VKFTGFADEASVDWGLQIEALKNYALLLARI
jgi:hypothetical protein